MWRLADEQLDTFIDRGQCEFLADYAKPFSMLVIADLLGVPLEDHEEFKAAFALETVGELGKEAPHVAQPAGVAQREVPQLHRGPQARTARRCAHRAGAGQTRGRLDPGDRRRHELVDVPLRGRDGDDHQAASVRRCASSRSNPGIQRPCCARTAARSRHSSKRRCAWKARSNRTSGWPGPRRPSAMSRCRRAPSSCCCPERATAIARKFEDPARVPRTTGRNVREQIAFIRGAHSCPGAPLARAEARISMNRILGPDGRTSGSPTRMHGPAGARQLRLRPDVHHAGTVRTCTSSSILCPTPDEADHVHDALRYAHASVGRPHTGVVRRRAGDVCMGGDPRRHHGGAQRASRHR